MSEFPEEAISVDVIGNEQILAVRMTDGVMIYITPNQLLQGYLKSNNIRTVNGESLIGTTDLKIVGGGSAETPATIRTKLGVASALNDGYMSKELFAILFAKADLVGGLIPLAQLPPVYIKGGSGSGTASDPFIVGAGGGGNVSAEAYLKALPGYEEGIEKILYGGITFSWGAIPSGSLEKLETPIITVGTPSVNGIPLSSNAVFGATNYKWDIDTSIAFPNPVTVYSGAATSTVATGLAANTEYFVRLKLSGAGYAPSNFATARATTAAAGNITPAPHTAGVVDDNANTFSWTDSPGYAAISNSEYTTNGGATAQQATVKPIPVGNVAIATGQFGVRVKAAAGRDASAWLFNTVPFTVTMITPAAPSNGVVNDSANTWTVTPPAGYTGIDLETSLDSKATWIPNTSNVFDVGNIAAAPGVVHSRVKAAAGRNAGPSISNATAFTVSIVGSETLLSTPASKSDSITYNPATGEAVVVEDDAIALVKFKEYIPAGKDGYVVGFENGLGISFHNKTDNYVNNTLINISRNPVNGNIDGVLNGTNKKLASDIYTRVYLKVSFIGTTIVMQYSLNGTDWIGTQTHVRPAGIDYYARVNGFNPGAGKAIQQLKQVGLSIDNTVV